MPEGLAKTVLATYQLNPPVGTDKTGLKTSSTHEYVVTEPMKGTDGPSQGQKPYYAALRSAIEQAKNDLGGELTAWRDAVGNKEQVKEPKIQIEEDADEDEGEVDEAS